MKKRRLIFLFLLIMGLLSSAIYFIYQKKFKEVPEPYINLYLHKLDITTNLSLENYLIGTVAAEMPASFEIEALKAQAVCARTYAFRKIIENRSYPRGADLSDDVNSCQAYISPQQFLTQTQPEFLDRVKKAVELTRGEIMVYNSEPIDAIYHSTCGGQTESAKYLWSKDVPYLQSTPCSFCKDSKHFKEELIFSNSQILKLIHKTNNKLDLKVISQSPGGRICTLSINGHRIDGAIFRKELGLPSQWFAFKIGDRQTIFSSRGYGHGIGLCQYGANGMAQLGKNYHDILKKYYRDIEFLKLPY